MFVQRKRSIIHKFNRFRCYTNNVAFINLKKMSGFTRGKLYKPFAYTFNGDNYKNFCIFDDKGRVMYMENNLIDKGVFDIVYTNKRNLDYKISDIMADVDNENEKYKELANEEFGK